MQKITLYVGLNDKDTKIQKVNTMEATKIVKNLICNICGGGTIYNAVGVYTHEDGTIITENTLQIELFDTPAAALADLIKSLKQVLNQESIIKETATVNSVFC